MGEIKRILAVLFVAFLSAALGMNPVHAATGDSFSVDTSTLADKHATRFFIASDNAAAAVTVHTAWRANGPGAQEEWWCSEFSGDQCDPLLSKDPTVHFGGFNVLPACGEANAVDCVASLSLLKSDGQKVSAEFVRQVGGIKFKADPATGLSEGSTVSIWSAPDAPSAGGSTTYAVNVRVSFEFDLSTKSFKEKALTASVFPYRLVNGPYENPNPYTIPAAKNLKGITGVGIDSIAHECVWNDKGECGIAQDFASGFVPQLSIRVSNSIGGWFKGRLQQPDIQVAKFSPTQNQITVSAAPVNVPRFAAVVSESNAPANTRDLYQKSGLFGPLFGGESAFTDDSGSAAFEYLDAFRAAAQDTAVGSTSLWSFGTIPATGNSCLSDTSRVLGLVTTNSMVYDGVAPQFNAGSLDYHVAGMHYLPGGLEPVTGTYDLVMRSDVARCLYGFTSAPIQASVSITTDGGAEKVATTTVKEDNGWLKLAAYGFTFSNPTLRVTLSQPGVDKVKSGNSASTNGRVLRCIRGSSVKKVVSNKCPAGYQLKK